MSQSDTDTSGVHPFSADFERWRTVLATLIPGNDIAALRVLMQAMKESDAAYGTPEIFEMIQTAERSYAEGASVRSIIEGMSLLLQLLQQPPV